MATYLLTWNPEQSPDDAAALNHVASQIAAGTHSRTRWSAGNTQTVQQHDRVFLLRQGRYAHGLIGSGTVAAGSDWRPHRDPQKRAQGEQGLFVEVVWESMLPSFELPRAQLLNGILPASLLRVGSSGAQIPPELSAQLEATWSAHLLSINQPTAVAISPATFDQQFSTFKSLVRANAGQDFLSFAEGKPAQWEGYKGPLRNQALSLLRPSSWTPAAVGTGRVLRRLIKAVELPNNNLVRWPNQYGHSRRSHRALLDALDSPPDRRRFEQWALDFFQNRLDDAAAFALFCQLAGPRYDVVAFLFFLKDWNRFMPIAPETFDKAFHLLAVDLTTSHQCCWQNYRRYNATLVEVQRLLRDVAQLSDPHLLDAHSFCWMLVRLGMPDAPPDAAAPLPIPIGAVEPIPLPPGLEAIAGGFQVITDGEFAERDERRRRLGTLAQDWALKSERRRLRELGHANPQQAVQPVWDQPGRGYDILSCEMDGTPRHIEVKAARRSGRKISFYLSAPERRKSATLANYHFYLVFDVESATREILMLDGQSLRPEFLVPTDFLASLSAPRP